MARDGTNTFTIAPPPPPPPSQGTMAPVCEVCMHRHLINVRCEFCGHVGPAPPSNTVVKESCSWECWGRGCTFAMRNGVGLCPLLQELKRKRLEDECRKAEELKRKRKPLEVRARVAKECAALAATSKFMDAPLLPIGLLELSDDVLTRIVLQHLEQSSRHKTPRYLRAQATELATLTAVSASLRRVVMLPCVARPQQWCSLLDELSRSLGGPPLPSGDVQAARKTAMDLVAARPEATRWLDPRLRDAWTAQLPHSRVGALATHIIQVEDEVLDAIIGCQDNVGEFSLAAMAGPFGSHSNDVVEDLMLFCHMLMKRSVFVIACNALAALLVDGWEAFCASGGELRTTKSRISAFVHLRHVLRVDDPVV